MEVKTIKEICTEYGLGQTDLARRFGIPLRTVQNWHSGRRPTPDYVARMIDELLKAEEKTKPKKLNQAVETNGEVAGYCPNCDGTVHFRRTALKKAKGHCCDWCGQAIQVEATRPLPVAAVELEKLNISKEQAEKIFFSLED